MELVKFVSIKIMCFYVSEATRKKVYGFGEKFIVTDQITFKVKVLTSCNTGFTLTLKVKIQDFESP